MNQPYSTCFSHFDEMVNLQNDLARFKARSQSRFNDGNTGGDGTGEPMDLDDGNTVNDAGEPMDLDPALNDPPGPIALDVGQSQEYFIEKYDGAAKEYGLGSTFMMEFNNDRFSNERTINIYYPFSSRAEWELAFFLLRSDLSMAAIDTFLSLNLVKTSFLQLKFTTDTIFEGSDIEFVISYSPKITRTR